MKKYLAAVLIPILLLSGCQREKEAATDLSRIKVALVLKTLNSPFFIDLRNGAEAAARQLKVELIVQAPEREIDVEKQMQIIENLVQTRVNAICLSPSGSKELIPAINKANRAGIPVLIVDTRIDETSAAAEGAKTVTFIGSDNYQGGRIAGQYVGSFPAQEIRVAILEGIPGHETGDNRLRGFRDEVRQYPQIKIVASQPANWERDQGYNVLQNLLQAYPEIDVVFACNDMMALGAMAAVAAVGKKERIKVIGFDAVAEARQEILAGNMEASIAQHPEEMGRLAVESAVKAIKGENIPVYIPVKIELITRQVLDSSR